jgi:hypothetical protein
MPESPLPPLPYPVTFVLRDVGPWKHLLEPGLPPPVEAHANLYMKADDNWCAQTYVQLRRRGLDVRFADHIIPGEICVTTANQLGISGRTYRCYLVACRHDRARPEIAEQRIVQNRLNILDSTDHYLPHWPQPGLIPRDPSRGDRIETLVYKGMAINLAGPFHRDAFKAELAKLGVQLIIDTGEYDDRHHSWNDYSQADLVLAVRDVTEYDLSIKPPSKLINAWHAGTPALLGPEPAYRQLRESDLDYIEVRTPEQAIEAVRRLKEDPILYRRMVDHSRIRAANFTADAIAHQWRDLLAGPIAKGYERWKRGWRFMHPLRFAVRAIKHRREAKRHQRDIVVGPRLFPS